MDTLGIGRGSFGTGGVQFGNRWGKRSDALCWNVVIGGRARAERDGTRAGTRFRLSPKRTSPFKSVGASVQSTAGSRGVRISFINTG